MIVLLLVGWTACGLGFLFDVGVLGVCGVVALWLMLVCFSFVGFRYSSLLGLLFYASEWVCALSVMLMNLNWCYDITGMVLRCLDVYSSLFELAGFTCTWFVLHCLLIGLIVLLWVL